MTGHRDLISVRSRGVQGDATASRTRDVCRYGVGCGFGVPIDLDPTILNTGLAGLNPIRDIANVRTAVLLAKAQFNVDNTKWLAGTGTDESWRHLEHRRHRPSHHDAACADRNHRGDRACRHLHLQAVHRGNQAHANAILAMHPNVIDASWHRAARASLRSSGRVATVRCSASGFLEWSTMQTSLTTTGQRLAILGAWSGFTIVDRLGAQIELIPHLFSATNRFPTGPSAGSCTSAISVVCHQAEHAALDLLRIAS
jgi:hypothetical protein